MVGPTFNSVATAAAAETVEEHSGEAENVFWAGWFCPFTQRSWIVLEEKEIPYQYKEVNPYLKEDAFLRVSPKGLTPGLEVGGRPLTDSTVISEFLDEFSPENKLSSEDPYDRAIARQVIDQINKVVVPAFFRLLQAQEPEKQAAELAELNKVLGEVSQKAKGPYFYGEKFSLVDVALAPWAVRDFISRDYRGFSRDAVPGWKAWAEALESRASVVKTSSAPEKYVEFNGTFLRNELHSLVGQAVAKGQAIL